MNERAVKHFALGQGQHAYQRSAVVQLCTMLLLCGSLAAAAAETLGWDSLSAEQQYTLARLRPRWHSLNAAARA